MNNEEFKVMEIERGFYLRQRPAGWADLISIAQKRIEQKKQDETAAQPSQPPLFTSIDSSVLRGVQIALNEEKRLDQSLWFSPLQAYKLVIDYNCVLTFILKARNIETLTKNMNFLSQFPLLSSLPSAYAVIETTRQLGQPLVFSSAELAVHLIARPPFFIGKSFVQLSTPQG